MNDPRVFITVFGRDIHWYGVMFAGGFLLAVVHWAFLGRKTKRPPGIGSDLALWMMIAGVVGARLMYVIQFHHKIESPLQILRIDQGGLVFYGGFIGGILGVLLLARFRKLGTWTLAGRSNRETVYSLGDFVTTALPLGHAMGRIGCFLHGCCFGKECDPAWYTVDHDTGKEIIQVYPSQLTEAAGLLVIYVILLWFYFRNKADGRVFALHLVLYGMLRFGNEFLRGDKGDFTTAGLTDAQWLSVAVLAAGVVLWGVLTRWNKRRAADAS